MPVDLATARRVLDRNRERLDRIEGVVGHGVGVDGSVTHPPPPENRVHLIVVYLERERDLSGVPASVDGVPVRYEVTGMIKAQ